jgi:hypothetical protein
MILSSASRTPIDPAERSTKRPPSLLTRPGLTPSGDLRVQGYPARNLPANARMKQNIEAWEAVSSDIQRALKLHFVDPSQSDISESALQLPDASSQSTMIVNNLQNSGTETSQPPRTEVLATKPLVNTTDPVRKAGTVFSGKID